MGCNRAPARLLALLRTACRTQAHDAQQSHLVGQKLQRTFHSGNPLPWCTSTKQAAGVYTPPSLSDLLPGRGGWAAWAGARESLLRQRQRCYSLQGLPSPLRALAMAAKSTLPAAPGKASLFSLQRWRQLQLPGAVGLQLRSLWQRYRAVLLALGAVVAVFVLWRTTFRLASFFVNITETLAEVGLLALAATIVAFVALYLRSHFTIDPMRVYRLAMYHLNTSPAILEVMGAPLVGGDVRVTVMSGGGPRLKGLRLKYKAPRVQMMFRLAGAERQGLVSMEVKKKKGKYIFKLLAVDVQSTGQVQQREPSAAEGAARIFVMGDPQYYERGGLIWDLRKPYLSALDMQQLFEAEDEDEEAQARQAKQQRRQQQQEQQQQQGTQAAPEVQPSEPAVPAAAAAAAQAQAPAPGKAGLTLWQRLWGSSPRAVA